MSQNKPLTFDVSPTVLSLGIKNICLRIDDLANRDSDPEFDILAQQVCSNIRSNLTAKSLKADPILQEFRNIHTRIGFSNRDYPAASESLLNALLKYGKLPQVNLLVDIYNLVSIETRLSLGAHDIDKIDGNVHLRLTTGTEAFWPLASDQPKPVRPGGYAYIDDANDIICMLEVRQVRKTKAINETQSCFYIIQGNAQTPIETLQIAAERMVILTKHFCGGRATILYQGS